jgi:hypothetical protein
VVLLVSSWRIPGWFLIRWYMCFLSQIFSNSIFCSHIMTDFSMLCFYLEGHNTRRGVWSGNRFGLSNIIHLFHVSEILLVVGFYSFLWLWRARMLFHFIESFYIFIHGLSSSPSLSWCGRSCKKVEHTNTSLYPSFSSAFSWLLIRVEWALQLLQKTFQLH